MDLTGISCICKDRNGDQNNTSLEVCSCSCDNCKQVNIPMKLIICSTMKPMLKEFIVEQSNAVRSWKHLRIKPEILIFGDDEGIPEFCTRHKIKNITNVKKNKKGVPLISDILKQTYDLCKDGDYVMYINADILLMDDFCDTLEAFNKENSHVKSCLLTAIRFDTFKFHKLKFDKGNEIWRKDVNENFIGKWCTPDGIDIFLHKRGNFKGMPDFAVARLQFDSWMVSHANHNFEKTINITPTVKIWHHLGDWYQNNRVVIRDWSRFNAIMDLESVNQNRQLSGPITKTLITDCKYPSYKEGNQIKFK